MMKIVISDYPGTLKRDIAYETELLQHALPDAEIVVHPYETQEMFNETMADADALVTAFLPIDREVMAHCPKLKCISINATGYNIVDLTAASERGIKVCAIQEYCTEEVADSAMALMLALIKKLKMHQHYIEDEHVWQYTKVGSIMRLRGKTLAIFGFGRIGQAVAKRAQAFGMEVVAVDPYLPPEVARNLQVRLVDREFVLQNAHIISNHMNVSDENISYFDESFFEGLQRSPFFINVARGVSVDENALAKALDSGKISGAGLDVLRDDSLSLLENPLVGRDNVIITPHAAFYSDEALRALQDISINNVIACLTGRTEDICYIVNP